MDEARLWQELGELKAGQAALLSRLEDGHATFHNHDERIRTVEKKVFLLFGLGVVLAALGTFAHDVKAIFWGGH